MILDSSVIVAILSREADALGIIDKMTAATTALKISAANYLESGIVIDRYGDADLSKQMDQMLVDRDVEIVPVLPQHARLAREAHRRFGRGSGSGARLNFGDCFAYALAKSTGEPLLFKGDDFGKTDILIA